MSRLRRFCLVGWLWLSLCLVLGLASCGFTGTGDIVSESIKQYGAQAYDRGLENAEFFICRAASVGSVGRRYMSDETKATAWAVICADVPLKIPVPANSSDAGPFL